MTIRRSVFPIFECFVLIIVLSLTISCASPPDLNPVSPTQAAPSPTPFQPQPAGVTDSPFTSPAILQPVPTFTPYPLPVLAPQVYPTPVQVIPSPGSAPSYLNPTLANPLTGLPPKDPVLLERRPMAVKITNYPRYVRPQSGLTLADVVFEYYIEDQLTRFIAVFYGNDSERAGPVRSGRYFDEHIARMYNAFLVFKFADPREFSYLKASDLDEFLVYPTIGSCPPFVVGKGARDTYNNIFFNTTRQAECAAREGVDNSRPPLRSGFFSEQMAAGALVFNRIFTRYSADDYNYWEYDPGTKKYFRYQETYSTRNGKPESYALLTDAVTGFPVTADNVVVLFVPHTFANQFEEEDEVYHIDLVESGEAFVFRNGFAYPARWYRTDTDQPLLIATMIGTPIFLKPGVTFYQVIGQSSAYSQKGTDWYFEFDTP